VLKVRTDATSFFYEALEHTLKQNHAIEFLKTPMSIELFKSEPKVSLPHGLRGRS
jgi:hypothetical protein